MSIAMPDAWKIGGISAHRHGWRKKHDVARMKLWIVQLYTLWKKHLIQKKRNRRQLILELVFPLLFIPLLLASIRRTPLPLPACPSCASLTTFGYACAARGGSDQCVDVGLLASPSAREIDAQVRRLPTFRHRIPHVSIFDAFPVRSGLAARDNVWNVVDVTERGGAWTMNVSVDFLSLRTALVRDKDPYLVSHYVDVQMAMYNALRLEAGENVSNLLTVRVKPFPLRPGFVVPQRSAVMTIVFFLFLMFSTPVVMGVVVGIATERQRQLLESLKMMGMSERVYFGSWALSTFCTATVGLVIMMMALKTMAPIPGWDPGLLVVFCVKLCASMHSFGAIVAVSFDTPRVAARGASLFLLGTFALFAALSDAIIDRRISLFWLTLLSIPFPAIPFGTAAHRFLFRVMSGEEVSIALLGDDPLVLWGVLMLIAYTPIFNVVLHYIRAVSPGQYGVALPPLYFLRRPLSWMGVSFAAHRWVGGRVRARTGGLLDDDDDALLSADGLEQTDGDDDEDFSAIGGHVALRLQNLSKAYGDVHALSNVSASFGDSQITALLGHNGAGKSTLISILSGLVDATGGDAFLHNHSVRDDLAWVRQRLGVCPQHDILFPGLTAYEHLWLCASLRGVSREQLDRDAERLFAAVGLKPATLLQLADTLSGGQKRKLAVAIAFVGDTKLVLLDEPTSGMDPHSRRELWTFLRQEQRSRCIILTTHSFDEAELLGDRVLLLSQGCVRAAGTVTQLKRRFGLGYHLKVKLLDRSGQQALDDVVQTHCGQDGAINRFDADQEEGPVIYVIPLDRASTLVHLLPVLDADRKVLQIESYAVYQTSLEEIFMRLAKA